MIEVDGLVGFAERWEKRTLPRRKLGRPVGRVEVRKEVWSTGGIEIARLQVHSADWWTVAVELDGGTVGRRRAARLDRWLPALADGLAMSYPCWVLSLAAGRS